MTITPFEKAITIKNARSAGSTTFNKLAYNATTLIGWGGQTALSVGNSNTASNYATDGTHFWFRATPGTTLKYNGANAEFVLNSNIFRVVIPENYDETIPFEIS